MDTSRTTTATLLALAATLALLAGALARDTDYCYQNESEKYILFASKTAYEFVRDSRRGAEILPHCTPLQVWWLNRHGTRYPGKSTIKSMAEKLPGLRDSILTNHQERWGRLCDADLEALQQWKLTVSEGQENVLTPAGELELYLTAKRLRDRFPEVLKLPYTSSRYKASHENLLLDMQGI
ncbi:Multiple inositol polyphosphate phosphatase 1 [Gryllus bimaculatus]|nr:Multiple inositol polyphosphate phosphatase 1 [Gryllus bimaculatus]